MKKLTVALALLTALSMPVSAQDFQKGYAAYTDGDYATALKVWKPLAEAGDAQAQSFLGTLYDFGRGVPQDYKEALKWYRLSAEQGYAESQSFLGTLYEFGEGVPQDYKEAVKWYRLAAEQGDAVGQLLLGDIYKEGIGVLQDNVMAHMWYNIGAANGDEEGGTIRDKLAKKMTPAAIEEAQAMARECMSSNYKKCGY